MEEKKYYEVCEACTENEECVSDNCEACESESCPDAEVVEPKVGFVDKTKKLVKQNKKKIVIGLGVVTSFAIGACVIKKVKTPSKVGLVIDEVDDDAFDDVCEAIKEVLNSEETTITEL